MYANLSQHASTFIHQKANKKRRMNI